MVNLETRPCMGDFHFPPSSTNDPVSMQPTCITVYVLRHEQAFLLLLTAYFLFAIVVVRRVFMLMLQPDH